MQRESRSKAAAAAPVQEPVPCPRHEEYQDTGAAWPNQPNIGLQDGDEADLMRLTHELKLGSRSSLPFKEKGPLQRAVEVYKQLPQSYKNKLWRTAADDLTATRHDNLLAPDSGFLPSEMRHMWEGMGCQAMCPDNIDDNGLCPWKDDCYTFYHVRQPRWNKQHEHSRICNMRWNLEEVRRREDVTLVRRRATLEQKKADLRARMKEERKLSAMMFNPTDFLNKQDEIQKIIIGIRNNQGEQDVGHFNHAIQQFQGLFHLPPFTLLDFQCAIADYFHDGMPGFRISSTKDPKISGIRVLDLNMIQVGKSEHQEFIYQFLERVLHTIHAQPPRLQRIKDELIALEQRRGDIFILPAATVGIMGSMGAALTTWRYTLELEGARVEDSLIPHLHLPADESAADTYPTSLSTLKRKHPIHSYHDYLQTGKRRMTIYIKTGEIDLLTKPEAQRIITFLLFVLFGPSHEAQLAAHPAKFTFDAHKGHMNRLLAKSRLPNVLRLVTPYNIADSAMTEKFKDVDPDDEDLAEEILEEEDKQRRVSAEVLKEKIKIKEDAKIDEEEEEEEDDSHAAAQKGDSRFIYTFNNGNALPFVVSDTNMIFDNNWLIYYKNKGFTQQYPYQFSMNLVDAGLHQYITDSKEKKIKNIDPSLYTVEAPFSTEITRGPSLNYLMMGLMRGSKSKVFGKSTFTDEQLYESLCAMPRDGRIVEGLLPIYTIPASSHSLPLFQHISSAPLFAYHMLYDLQHRISALPSRIKWAGDREQYMAIKGVPLSVFVTLDTTAYYCAFANNVTSLLERKKSIKLVGFQLDAAGKGEIATRAAQTPQQAADLTPAKKGARGKPATKGAPSALAKKVAQGMAALQRAQPKLARKGAQSKPDEIVKSFAVKGVQPIIVKKGSSTKKSTEKDSMKQGGNYTRKSAKQGVTQSKPGREYFFLNWLYPLTMSVHAAFYGHHAEHAYVLLKNLQKDLSYPLLFPALQEQLIHAVSLIPNVPKDLMDAVKNITADTYDIVAPECLSRLEALYTSPRLSIFSQPAHKETLLGYLREMKEKLSRRHPSNDTTTTMLHLLLTPDLTPDQEKVCLVLSLLFERLHGRIQSGTSYLGQILGVTGGPELESVDDREVWEDLTDVLMEDMEWITDLSRYVAANAAVDAPVASPVDAPVASPVASPANAANAATPIATRRISAKRHHVKRGPAFLKLNKAFTQLRSNRASRASRAPSHAPRASPRVSRAPRATMTQNSRRVIMGGSRTRRAKGSQRSRRSQCKD